MKLKYLIVLVLLALSSSVLADIERHFYVKGKFSIMSEEGGYFLNFKWTQEDDQYKIRLRDTTHVFGAKIDGSRIGVNLQASNWKEPVYSYSPNTLFQDYFNLSFPILNLIYWIQGQAAPSSPHQAKGEAGKKNYILEQDGWTIRYAKYKNGLPRTLHAEGEGIKIKMILKKWRLGPVEDESEAKAESETEAESEAKAESETEAEPEKEARPAEQVIDPSKPVTIEEIF